MTEIQKRIIEMQDEGLTILAIARRLKMTEPAVRQQIKCIKLNTGTYNSDHIFEKYQSNEYFLSLIKVETVLDLFCGENNWWKNNTKLDVTSNDLNTKIVSADIHSNARELLKLFVKLNVKFDLIDIDPYGSPIAYFQDALKISNRGIIITLGDNPTRMKRFPGKFKNYYRINYGLDMDASKVTDDDLIKHFIDLAKKENKTIKLELRCQWKTASRYYFSIL